MTVWVAYEMKDDAVAVRVFRNFEQAVAASVEHCPDWHQVVPGIWRGEGKELSVMLYHRTIEDPGGK